MFSNPSPKKKEGKSIIFNYPIIDTIELIKPSYIKPINFWDVINDRRSTREFHELSLDEISKILWISAKVKEIFVQDNGYVLTQRPSASAGARHPIDIVVLSTVLDSLKSIYYYNPFSHNLNRLTLKTDFIEQLKSHVNLIFDLKISTIFWFVAHPSRTEAKYKNYLSLVWRDAGALIHSIQITCAGLGINSCAVGTLGEPYISKMFLENGEVFGVGGVIVG